MISKSRREWPTTRLEELFDTWMAGNRQDAADAMAQAPRSVVARFAKVIDAQFPSDLAMFIFMLEHREQQEH